MLALCSLCSTRLLGFLVLFRVASCEVEIMIYNVLYNMCVVCGVVGLVSFLLPFLLFGLTYMVDVGLKSYIVYLVLSPSATRKRLSP